MTIKNCTPQHYRKMKKKILFFFFFPAAPCHLQDLSSRPGIEPASPAVEVQSPNHWTAREFPPHPRQKTF